MMKKIMNIKSLRLKYRKSLHQNAKALDSASEGRALRKMIEDGMNEMRTAAEKDKGKTGRAVLEVIRPMADKLYAKIDQKFQSLSGISGPEAKQIAAGYGQNLSGSASKILEELKRILRDRVGMFLRSQMQ